VNFGIEAISLPPWRDQNFKILSSESLIFGFQSAPMSFSRLLLLPVFVILFLTGCKQKSKPTLSGEDPVEVSDFIEFFQPVKLPYQFTDSLLQRKENDSLLISYKVFTQFVPDSVLTTMFGKSNKIKIYPAGKAGVPKGDSYLFTKAVSAGKAAVYLLAFNNKNEFIAALPVLHSDAAKSLRRTTVMDKKFTVTRSVFRKNADASISEGKDVYVLNADAKEFMLIMTEALEDKVTELINPIDTLPRKHKLSADYTTGKMNLVSVRDGRRSDRLSFFIHFEKNNGECTGELKGEAVLKSASMAEYRVSGEPCVLQFRFTASSVTLSELEGCGSRRGVRCTFNGVYPRKKEIKPKPVKAKPAGKK
jgi:hypothetical protein